MPGRVHCPGVLQLCRERRGPVFKMKHIPFLSGVIASFCMAAMVIILLIDIAIRPFGLLLHSAGDIATFLMVAVAYFGFVHTFAEGKHIRVELLTRRFPPAFARPLEIASLILAAVLLAWLAYTSGKLTYTAWRFNDMTDTVVRIPLWIPTGVVPLGLGLFALAAASDAFSAFVGHQLRHSVSEADEALALAGKAGQEIGQ